MNEEQPRDEHGRFAETDGSGGGSLGKWAEKRVATHIQSGDSVRAQLEKTGAKAFEGVPAAAVREVHHYDGQTGLKLVVKRNDGARDRYIYTDEHHQKQAEYRFARAQQMVEAVGATREAVNRDLHSEDPKTRALAVAARLIDDHTIRVGGGKTEQETGSVGVTSLRAEHLSEHPDGGVRLKFPGKSGKEWDVHVRDPELAESLRSHAEGKEPGAKLLGVGPKDVNEYLENVSPIKVTAKDYRTFHASVTVDKFLREQPPAKTPREAQRNVKAALEAAAERLGNTPAICKSAYVNPSIIERYLEPHTRKDAPR